MEAWSNRNGNVVVAQIRDDPVESGFLSVRPYEYPIYEVSPDLLFDILTEVIASGLVSSRRSGDIVHVEPCDG